MATPKQDAPKPRGRRPPATSLEADERRLINLARDLAEERMRKGTATSQEIVHFLRLGTTQHRLEQENLRQEILLKNAKVESLASGQRIEELYADAIRAMKKYGGHQDPDDDYED